MRHLKSGRALGVKPAHRRAMMRNLVTSVLEHQQIRTTVARAKELRKPLDKMITLGKKGDLNARRRALRFVKSKQAMQMLFSELPERYEERQGGYVRIIRLGPRKGDGADMALVQLVDAPNDALANAQKPKARRRGAGRGRTVTEEVAAQVKGKGKQEEAAEATEAADQQGKPSKEEAKKGKAEAKAESKAAKEQAKKQKAEAKAESKAAKEKEKTESKAAKEEAKKAKAESKAAAKDEAPASKAEASPEPEKAKQDDETKS